MTVDSVTVDYLFRRVRAAFCAAALRAPALRRRAAVRAWRARAGRDAALRPSRRSAREIARDRAAEGLRPRPLLPAL